VIIIIPLHVPYTNYNTSTSINKLTSIQVICLSKLGVPRIGFRAGQRPKQNGFRAGQRHNVNMFNKSKQTFPKNYGPPTQLGYNNSEVPAIPPFLMYPWGPSFNPSLYTNTTKNSWYPQFTTTIVITLKHHKI
jgi:hypothetical protein